MWRHTSRSVEAWRWRWQRGQQASKRRKADQPVLPTESPECFHHAPQTPLAAPTYLSQTYTHTQTPLSLSPPPLLPIPVLPLRYTLPFLFIPCQIPHTAHQQEKGTDSSSLSRRLPATSTTFFPEMIFTEINRYNGKKGKLISLFPGRQLSTSTSGITRGILIRVYGTVRRK